MAFGAPMPRRHGPRGCLDKLTEAFQSSKRCFSWVVFGGMYLSDYLLDSPKIGTYLILFCLTQMKITSQNFGRRFGGVIERNSVWHSNLTLFCGALPNLLMFRTAPYTPSETCGISSDAVLEKTYNVREFFSISPLTEKLSCQTV